MALGNEKKGVMGGKKGNRRWIKAPWEGREGLGNVDVSVFWVKEVEAESGFKGRLVEFNLVL